jgi:hypothetical protein
MTTTEILEWVGLNVAAAVVLVVPNWIQVLPDMERWAEVLLKFTVMATVIGVNIYKIIESHEKRKSNRNKPDTL